MKDGLPIILIECKYWKQDLSLHDTQLKKYFVASKARFGILTNGIRYLFYSDLIDQNIMDDKPFFEFDITDIKEYQLEELKKFHKSYFDVDSILSSASELKYSNELKNLFANEFINPSPEFVKYFTKQIYDGIITAKIQEQFCEIIKRSFTTYINELISKRLKTALNTEESSGDTSARATDSQEPELSNVDNKIITTKEELDGFMIIKALVRKSVDINRVVYRDAQSYFAVLLDDNNRKPICRLYFNSKSKKYVSTFDKERNEVRHEISDLNDIFNFENDLCNIIKIYDEK